MGMTGTRGTNGRPTTDAVLDPQAAKEARITAIFHGQAKQLAGLFPKDGMTLVARSRQGAIMASRAINDKTGRPNLEAVSAEQIAEKVIAIHHMGLEVGEEAYLVPYGNKVQIIVGPKGIVKQMYRSGFVASVEYHDVFGEQDPRTGEPIEPAADFFFYGLGDKPEIRHRKGLHGRRALPISHVYGVVHTTTGGVIREVLTYEDVEFYRGFSKMKSGPAWTDNWAGMARKTLLHRIADMLPRSPVLAAVLSQNAEGGVEVSEEIMALLRSQNTAPAEPVIEQAPANGAPVNEDAENTR